MPKRKNTGDRSQKTEDGRQKAEWESQDNRVKVIRIAGNQEKSSRCSDNLMSTT